MTLPGTPAVAAGSNGSVAWGFTNSYGDFADARWGKCASAEYRVRRERIEVKGGDDVEVGSARWAREWCSTARNTPTT